MNDADLVELNIQNFNSTEDKPIAPSTRFIPPSIEEIKAYCDSRNNNVSPEDFYDFYQSKGWVVGKNKMKDWKAAVRTWEKSYGFKPKEDLQEDVGFREVEELPKTAKGIAKLLSRLIPNMTNKQFEQWLSDYDESFKKEILKELQNFINKDDVDVEIPLFDPDIERAPGGELWKAEMKKKYPTIYNEVKKEND